MSAPDADAVSRFVGHAAGLAGAVHGVCPMLREIGLHDIAAVLDIAADKVLASFNEVVGSPVVQATMPADSTVH